MADSDSQTELVGKNKGKEQGSDKKEENKLGAKKHESQESAENSLNPKSTFSEAVPVKSVTFENQDSEEDDNNDSKNNSKEKKGSRLKQESFSKEDVLKKHLPYYNEFSARAEKSVLSLKDFNNDPEGYLQAILKKYTIEHPKELNLGKKEEKEKESEKEKKENSKEETLYPWIEGVMDKLMPETGMFGRVRYKSRLFRLFDEALVWFDDPNLVTKWLHKNETTMKPLGVLPLAMVSALRTVDLNKEACDVMEDDLLKLELQIGNEGVIVLRCADFRQRIKWFECLHSAIFSVAKPVFTQKQGMWRISEEGMAKTSDKQLTTQKMQDKEELNKKLRNIHVRMGTSLILTVEKLKKSNLNITQMASDDNTSDNDNDNDNDKVLDNAQTLDGANKDDKDDKEAKDSKDEKQSKDKSIEMNTISNDSSDNQQDDHHSGNDNDNDQTTPALANTHSSNNSAKPNRKIL